MRNVFLVAYDVADDKRRTKVFKKLKGRGEAVQYSVFRCWLTPAQMERLRWELTEKLAAEDEVLLMPLCGRCVSGIVGIYARDRPPEWTDQPPRHTVV